MRFSLVETTPVTKIREHQTEMRSPAVDVPLPVKPVSSRKAAVPSR